jgi:hypothetical protein
MVWELYQTDVFCELYLPGPFEAVLVLKCMMVSQQVLNTLPFSHRPSETIGFQPFVFDILVRLADRRQKLTALTIRWAAPQCLGGVILGHNAPDWTSPDHKGIKVSGIRS